MRRWSRLSWKHFLKLLLFTGIHSLFRIRETGQKPVKEAAGPGFSANTFWMRARYDCKAYQNLSRGRLINIMNGGLWLRTWLDKLLYCAGGLVQIFCLKIKWEIFRKTGHGKRFMPIKQQVFIQKAGIAVRSHLTFSWVR